MNTATILDPSTPANRGDFADITISAAVLRRGLSLVSHAKGDPFHPKTHLDLDWSSGVDKHGRQGFGVTATDGFRFARFATSDAARFDAHDCRAPLPHWIVDWCKASDTATVNVCTQGDRAVFTFSDYGTFRPSALPFFAWTSLVGELRRLNNPSFCYSRPGSEMGSLVKFLEEGRRDHSRGAPVFILPGQDTAWTLAFGEKPHSVSLNPTYLMDALKSLARAARDADKPDKATVDAQWSGGLDPVAFTAPNLLTLIMPRRK